MEDETGAPPQLYLRSTVSFVAQGWVTGQILGVDGGLATVRPR